MKTTNLTTGGATPSKTKILSRFHPRLKKARNSDTQETPLAQKPIAAPMVPLAVAPRIAARKPPAQLAPEYAEQKIFTPRGPAPKAFSAEDSAEPDDQEPVVERMPLTPMHYGIFAAALILGFFLTFWYGRSLGHDEAMRLTKHSDAGPHPKLPPEAVKPFETALTQLREDKPLEALSALRALLADHPYAPSLHYAAALAAMQTGYDVEAGMMADASIRLGFRVSDSLALKAAISALKAGRPSDDQEKLLNEAIAADPMNPNPLLELATLQRYRGKNSEALALLESAALRMTPTDSRAVLDTTLAIMRASSEPAPNGAPTGIPTRDFPAALAELQRGNFNDAAAILRATQKSLSPDLFSYLINDPELRKFSRQPELAGLF